VALAGVTPGIQRDGAINSTTLEHLLAHLIAPRQAGNTNFGHTLLINYEHPSGGF